MNPPNDDAGATSTIEDRLAAAFEKAVAKQQPPAAPPQQMSEQELQRMLGHWRPDNAVLQQLFGEGAGEPHQTAFSQMLERIEEMIDRRAQMIAQGTLADYHGSIQPHLNDARELAEARFQDMLFSGDGERFKPHEKILSKLLPTFRGEKDFPQSRAEQAKYIHAKFGELVGDVAAPAGAAPRQQAPTSLPALGGGAGGSGGAPKTLNPATASGPMTLSQVMNGGAS